MRLIWALGLSWEWVVEGAICWTKTWLLVVLACAIGMMGHGRLGTLVIAFNCALNTVVFLIISVSYCISLKGPMIPLGELSSTTTLWRRMIANGALFLILLWEGPFTIDVFCLLLGFLCLLMMASQPELVTGIICAVVFSMAFSLQVARWYVKTWVERTLVRQDFEKFNSLCVSVRYASSA